MANSKGEARRRRLTEEFAAWLDEPTAPEAEFYRRGLIVLDTNVLLDLYRVNPDTRGQVIKALSSLDDRLWVPHQAAMEFARNRKQAVIDRLDAFKSVRLSLRDAASEAVAVLESALNGFERLRSRNGESGAWDTAAAGLDRESLQKRLEGVMNPAIAELETMGRAHDLNPGDMQSADDVLKQVDQLLAGRIGPAYQAEQMRALVDEAMTYRYPNLIPPGYGDIHKKTPLRAAGDFLLWRQTIDRVNLLTEPKRLVLLITNDAKPDWWASEANRGPLKPRPELVQEMRDQAQAHLCLTSLADFLKAAGEHLTPGVSEQAVDQLRQVGSARESRSVAEVTENWALRGTGYEFRNLIVRLLDAMGYAEDSGVPLAPRTNPDAVVTGDGVFGTGTFLVEARHYASHPVQLDTVRKLHSDMIANEISGGIVVTSGSFRPAAMEFAREHGVHLVAGGELGRLIADHLRSDPGAQAFRSDLAP